MAEHNIYFRAIDNTSGKKSAEPGTERTLVNNTRHEKEHRAVKKTKKQNSTLDHLVVHVAAATMYGCFQIKLYLHDQK